MLLDVHCQGTERSIAQCKHKGWKESVCNHYEDASVRCNVPQIQGHKVWPRGFRPVISCHFSTARCLSSSPSSWRLGSHEVTRVPNGPSRSSDILNRTPSRYLGSGLTVNLRFMFRTVSENSLHHCPQVVSLMAYCYLAIIMIYLCF